MWVLQGSIGLCYMKKCLINNDISSFGLQMYTQYGVPVIEAMATKGTYCSLIRQCGKAKNQHHKGRKYSQSRWFKVTLYTLVGGHLAFKKVT